MAIVRTHAAMNTLAGMKVGDRRIQITAIETGECPDVISGRLVDDKNPENEDIAFSITAGELEYENPSFITDVWEGLKNGIEQGQTFIPLSYA